MQGACPTNLSLPTRKHHLWNTVLFDHSFRISKLSWKIIAEMIDSLFPWFVVFQKGLTTSFFSVISIINLEWSIFIYISFFCSYFLLFLSLFFNWRIVDLQCCVSFRCTTKWFIYSYIYKFNLFRILFHSKLLEDMQYSSLCYTGTTV